MKVLKTLVAVALVAGCVQQVSAQVVKKKSGDDAQKAKSPLVSSRSMRSTNRTTPTCSG